jgi:hypothetical protein
MDLDTTITIAVPIALETLKGLCLSEVVQSGELGPHCDSTSEEPPEPLSTNTIPLSIAMIGPVPLTQKAKQNQLQINAISLREINNALDGGKDNTKITDIVTPEYHEFLPLFSEAEANTLLPHCLYDYHIPLTEGFTLPFGPSTTCPAQSWKL